MAESIGKTLRYGSSGFVLMTLATLLIYLIWVLEISWMFNIIPVVTLLIGYELARALIDDQRVPVQLLEWKDEENDRWIAYCPKCGFEINSDDHRYGCHMKTEGTCMKGCKEYD